jgi:excisionase family DNA binding protein
MASRTAHSDEPLNDLEWLSAYLGIPEKTIYAWRLRNEGPPAYRVGRHLRWRKSEVDQWLRERHDTDDQRVGSRH